MKKIFFILIFGTLYVLYSSSAFADTLTSTYNWTVNVSNSCPNLTSHGVVHYGIPNTNISNAGTSGGTIACTNHSYYASSNHPLAVVYNNGSTTPCPAGERVVAYNGSNQMTCQKYDDTTPTVADISYTCPTSELAVSSKAFSVPINTNGGSPITEIEVAFETNTNNTTYNIITSTVTSSTLNFTRDISLVDFDRGANGGRQFWFRIIRIKDEAGNQLSGTFDAPLKNCDFNVYANSTAMGTKSATNQLSSTTNIADGTVKNLTITLKDVYGNQIIPATGIGRTIDFNWNVTNTMYLNQHSRVGTKSVFVNKTTDPVYLNRLDTSSSFNGETSTNGIYNYGFRVYTPTANQNNGPISDTSAAFNINSITFDIHSPAIPSWEVLSQPVGSSTITSKFSPIYYTAISGDLDDGMIAGITQQSKIGTYKNGGAVTSSPVLKVEFGGTDSGDYNFLHTIGAGCSTASTFTTSLMNSVSNISFPSTNNDLCTRINQKPGVPVSGSMSSYFSTHVSYALDGYNITYNSDIVGKDAYWGTESAITYQAGVKVSGITSSQKTMSLTTSQDGTDLLRIGDNMKTTQGVLALNQKTLSKEKILKNAYDFIRNVSRGDQTSKVINNLQGTVINPDWKEIKYSTSKSVIYYRDLAGANVVLDNSTKIGVSGKRTILIYGGNLYIKSNIFYNGTNDILGIIVLKDKNDLGGKIYIDPSVTNINGTLFAEKSVMSYDGVNELDGNTIVSKLRHQLHIYGNVLSENTLGGSTMATPKCPYYVLGTCDQVTAQKYDLNFLRRYFLTSSNVPYHPAGLTTYISGGGTCSAANNCSSDRDSDLSKIRYFTTTSDPYAKYPVIIEYNSQIQSAPPQLFQN